MEFLVVALPLLLAAMASYEASRWYMTREAVSLALLEAGRAGSVNHARPRAIEDAFLDALTPLYAPAGDFRDPRERMIHQHKRVEQNSNQLAWDIIITHPNIAEFADFMQKDLPIAVQTGNPAINNNYQQRQHQQFPRAPPRVARSTMPTPCNCSTLFVCARRAGHASAIAYGVRRHRCFRIATGHRGCATDQRINYN
ncbi:hypothetical protein [Advenella kashmirensis]|uniref:hypothetical protein n=1 Tax=Advenella kashmirensis TaxID=310575 RepID=UPI0011D19A9F|nr:hypothetical protein [Advenella kashmirensis]